jgi:hypothetical protein
MLMFDKVLYRRLDHIYDIVDEMCLRDEFSHLDTLLLCIDES